MGDPAAVLGSSLWSAPLLFRALGECTSKWNSLSVSLCLSAQKKEPIYLQTSILFWSQLALWGVECLTPGGTYLSAGILSEERETHGDASTIQLSQHTASCPSMTGAETGPENEGFKGSLDALAESGASIFYSSHRLSRRLLGHDTVSKG